MGHWYSDTSTTVVIIMEPCSRAHHDCFLVIVLLSKWDTSQNSIKEPCCRIPPHVPGAVCVIRGVVHRQVGIDDAEGPDVTKCDGGRSDRTLRRKGLLSLPLATRS